MAALIFDTYGKTRVRLLQVTRDRSRHEIIEWNTQILLEGDLAESYIAGDNSKVLPTDTMKNTVYALARRTPIMCVEQFARDLGQHFLGRLQQLRQVKVEIEETPWSRIGDYNAAFTQTGQERRVAACTVAAIGRNSHFRNSQSPNPENGRTRALRVIQKTNIQPCLKPPTGCSGQFWMPIGAIRPGTHDLNGLHTKIRARLLATFALHRSRSVQHTLYAMAESVIEEFAVGRARFT